MFKLHMEGFSIYMTVKKKKSFKCVLHKVSEDLTYCVATHMLNEEHCFPVSHYLFHINVANLIHYS